MNDCHKIEPKEFRREQIKMLWGHLPLIFLADIATGSFLLLLLVTTAYNPLSFFWYGTLAASTAIRAFLPITGEQMKAPEPVKIVRNEKASYEGKTLVVEDNESVRDVASHMLKTVGFDVITAHNGSSGLSEYKTNLDIDLVFSDVIMPGGMTGVELATKILKISRELPILLATGYAEKELKDQLIDHKNVVLVAKPYDTNELPDLINSMMLQNPKAD